MSSAKVKSRKDRIMEAALRIFAEKCYQDATITEISKEAGVSEATVYEYFGTKEDLLFAIPERISNHGYDVLRHILPYIKGAEGKIRAIIYAYFNLYQTNPHYSGLVLLQLMTNKRFRQTEAFEAIRKSARLLLECIKEGIADGTFRKDVDPYLLRSILLGTIEHLFIHWHMRGRPSEPKELISYLDPFLEIILNGVKAPKEERFVFLKITQDEAEKLEPLLTPSYQFPSVQSEKKDPFDQGSKREKKGKTIKRKEKVLC